MTTAAVVILCVAGLFSLLDWIAVARANATLEYVAKPAATTAFLLVAVLVNSAEGTPQGWRVAALVFCVAGDVFLMLPRDAFVPGLASFAVAQMLFVVSFMTQDPTAGRLLLGILLGVPVTVVLARRFIGALAAGGHRELIAPVVIYMVVITSMVVSGVAGGTAWGIAGAVAFMVSDSLIAETRFVKSREWHGVAIMVTYHAALVGLVAGLL